MDKGKVDVVLVRMDKIGDLVLSLPVDVHPAFTDLRVHWLITQGLGFVVDHANPNRPATEFKRGFTPVRFMKLLRWLRHNRPQMMIFLHNPWWVTMAAWMARVPIRMGRKSQWHSILFLNLHILQKRSVSDRHESDYNFDLVEWGFNRLGVARRSDLSALKSQWLKLAVPQDRATATLTKRGLSPSGYRVVHPGMAGSALNWPSASFLELINKLAEDMPVVITGTKMDAKYLKPLKTLHQNPGVRWMVGELNPLGLLDVLSQARSVVAPSTGVLHLAAALGTPCLGIYSPRKVEHPRRWGPKGSCVAVLVPDQWEDSTTETAKSAQAKAQIMAQVTPRMVHQRLLSLEQQL